MSHATDDVLMTVPEAAAFLRESQTTIYRWVKDGRIPALRPYHKLLFMKSDLLAYLRRQTMATMNGRDAA